MTRKQLSRVHLSRARKVRRQKDFWANYDPGKARLALRKSAGAFGCPALLWGAVWDNRP